MSTRRRHAARVVSAAALGLATLPGLAQSVDCETLRTQIEAKIRANGVPAPRVEVLDAATETRGRVVGQCERGSRKIVYAGAGAAASAPVAGAPASAARKPKVITECADGRVISEGSCRKQP